MFTKEELELIKEQLGEDYARKIELLQEDYLNKVKTEEELKQGLQKIFSNPRAKRKFEEVAREAGLNYEIPKYPHEEDIKELAKELEEVKKEQYKRTIFEKLAEYGLTSADIPKIVEFQKNYNIKDDLKAIELYAAYIKPREAELEPVAGINPFNMPEDYTEETAKKLILQDLKRIGLVK
jgi:hypothetical protein